MAGRRSSGSSGGSGWTVPGEASSSAEESQRVADLRIDLAAARLQMQQSLEEWATTSEELRSANEELVEANARLHAAGEQLGVANAELQALNAELHRRVAELDRAYADLENLLDSTQVAAFFVDRGGRIRRFTPAVGTILAIGLDAVGTPLADILAPRFDVRLQPLLDDLLVERLPIEREVGTTAGAWYQLRLLPYRTRQGAVDGAVVTLVDLTVRHAAEVAMANLNDEFERRVAQRTRELGDSLRELESFSYSISHDLKAPLRAIAGFSQALGEEYAPRLDDDGRHYIERIRAGALQMGRLIDDLLSLAHVARADMHWGTVGLSDLAAQVVAELQRDEQQRDVRVTIAPNLFAAGDVVLLRAVLTNLLGNAWKFTRARPTAHIEFGTCDSARGPAYFVRDDGAGFDMRYADKLFHPFQRLHDAHEFEGTGIGLATVRRVIDRHGGETWADAAVDRGATFYFRLPARH